MLISTTGTMIKIPVEDVRRMGRSTQGVIVMRLRGDEERVSSLAPVVEPEEETEDEFLSADAAPTGEEPPDAEPEGTELGAES
jgi:DNA gyrase subunit A